MLWSCCDAWYEGGNVGKIKLIGFSFCIFGFSRRNMKFSLLIVGEECPCNQRLVALSLK